MVTMTNRQYNGHNDKQTNTVNVVIALM